MENENPVFHQMDNLLAAWEPRGDRRMIFLECYKMMTGNILQATASGYFEDNLWVRSLMERFASYYFSALQAYDGGTSPTRPWQIAFKTCLRQETHVLQHLLLGLNAHINYDLVFALCDVLSAEWPDLSPEQRQRRYRDHTRVNEIIHQTINAVQDQVVDRFEPIFGVVDFLLGPLDEWMTTLFISRWREEVWQHAALLLDSVSGGQDPAIVDQVERRAIDRARDILGQGSLTELAEFF